MIRINREKGHKTMIVITDLFIFISCRLPISFRASCQNQGEAKNWDRHQVKPTFTAEVENEIS